MLINFTIEQLKDQLAQASSSCEILRNAISELKQVDGEYTNNVLKATKLGFYKSADQVLDAYEQSFADTFPHIKIEYLALTIVDFKQLFTGKYCTKDAVKFTPNQEIDFNLLEENLQLVERSKVMLSTAIDFKEDGIDALVAPAPSVSDIVDVVVEVTNLLKVENNLINLWISKINNLPDSQYTFTDKLIAKFTGQFR